MDSKLLDKLNHKLGLAFGFSYDQPNFKWIWSDELTTYMKDGYRYGQSPSGLILASAEYKPVKQLEGEGRWVFAALMQPVGEGDWTQRFGDSVPYPAKGYYIATSWACKVGVEPTEELTDEIIANQRINSRLSEKQHEDNFTQRIEKRTAEKNRRIDDIVHDAAPAFDNVPGQKNHVSFGGL